MDISEIAIDVLKIQLLTSDLSKPSPCYRISQVYSSEPRDFYDLRYIKHFIKLYKWFDTSYSAIKVTFNASKVQPIDDKAGHKVQPLNYYGFRLQAKCSCR